VLTVVAISTETQPTVTHTFLEASFNMSLRSACSTDEAIFVVNSEVCVLGTTLLKYRIVRISELSDAGLKEFCCV
jgi:hypothetical protein